MNDPQTTAKPLPFDLTTMPGIISAFENLHNRVTVMEAALEQAMGSGPSADAVGNGEPLRVLKHMYDWAQHFGMPALPSTVERPKPVAPPPAIQPAGFDPFAK